jgi:hypothetical protein
VKHLLYEHQNNISELKAESTVALKLAQDDHRSNELDLRKDKRSLKVELKEQELSHEDVIKNLKKVCWMAEFQIWCHLIFYLVFFFFFFYSLMMRKFLT